MLTRRVNRISAAIFCIALMVLGVFVADVHAEQPYEPIGPSALLGTWYDDRAYDVCKDGSGNVIITGSTKGSIDGVTANNGNMDMFVAKFDPSFSLEWVRQEHVHFYHDNAYGVTCDATGNIYAIAFNVSYFVIVKYSPDGTRTWLKTYGESNMVSEAYDIKFGPDGNLYVTGCISGVFNGVTGKGGEDIFVAKLDTDGNILWSDTRGSSNKDHSVNGGLDFDSSGNLYVAGGAGGDMDGQTHTGAKDKTNICLIKYDPAGNWLWTRLVGSGTVDDIEDLVVDDSGNAYVVGQTRGSLPGYTFKQWTDIFVVKYDTDGNMDWLKQLGTDAFEYLQAAVLDSSGNLFVAGSDGGGLNGQTNAGRFDILLMKYTPDGTRLWTKLVGTSLDDKAYGLYMGADDELLVAGISDGKLLGNKDHGSFDAFVISMNPPEYDPPVSVITDPSDGVTLPAPLSHYTIRGTADDGTGSGVSYVQVSTDGGGTWHTAAGRDNWTYHWAPDCNGGYNIISKAVDYLGNMETPGAGINVTIDNYPISEVKSPAEREFVNPAAGSYTITGVTHDFSCSGLTGVEVSTDSGSNWNTATNDSGDWTEWSYVMAPLPLGNHTIQARASDVTPRTETPSQSVTLIVDGTPPSCTLDDPTEGQDIDLALGKYTITGTAQDLPLSANSGLNLVEVSVDGGATWHRTAGGRNWSYKWAPPGLGTYSIQARATDNVGNVSSPTGVVHVNIVNSPYDFLWTKMHGTPGNDQALDVVTDASGNAYAVGYTGGSFAGYTSAGGADIFLTKYDAGGNRLWTVQTGSSAGDYALGVDLDNAGNIYVTGYTFGDMAGAGNAGGADAFVVKFDQSGVPVWTYQSTDPEDDYGRAVSVNELGSTVLAGYTREAGGTDFDYALTILYGDGTEFIRQTGGADGNDVLLGVALDGDRIYAAGYSDGSFGGAGSGGGDLILVKFGSDGNELWIRKLGSVTDDMAYGVAVDTSHNVIMSGVSFGDFDGHFNQGEFDPFAGGYTSDAVLAKYDPYGNKLWSAQVGSAGNDAAYGVDTDSFGSIYITGYAEGPMYGGSYSGSKDAFVYRLNSEGIGLWSAQIGTPGTDTPYGISVDTNDMVYIVGASSGDLEGNTNQGSYDLFVSKLGPELSSVITDPVDAQVIGTNSYLVKGMAFDYSANSVLTVDVSTDGGSSWNTATDTSGTGSWSSWEYSWSPAPLGSHTLRSRATNDASDVETPGKGVTVTVDYEYPVSAYTYPLSGAFINVTSATLTGTASDLGTGVANVEVSDDGSNWYAATDTSGDGSWSTWSYGWTIPSDGVYTLTSRATDNVGNVETPGAGVFVTVDRTPPVSSVTGPADGTAIKGVSYTVEGTVSDNLSGVYSVEVSSDGGSVWSFANYTGGAAWSFEWTLPADGTYNLLCRATDNANNSETPGPGITVDVDNTPPASAITDPADGGTVSSTPYSVSGTASDNQSGVTGVVVSTDGGADWYAASDTSGDGSWSTWEYFWNITGIGTYNLVSKASDAAGNGETPGAGITANARSELSAGRTSITLVCNKNRPEVVTRAEVTASPWPVFFNLSGSDGWLGLSVSAPMTDASAGISVDQSSLSVGGYNGTLSVISGEAANSPLDIPVYVTVEDTALLSELPHYDYNGSFDGGTDCGFCHDAFSAGTFVAPDADMKPAFCGSCHTAAGVAHERNGGSGAGHPTGVSANQPTTVYPTYGNATGGACDDRMYANLDSDNVECVTCHNPMCKTEDYARVWERTYTGDNITYFLTGGGWSSYGRLVPKVYRDTVLWNGPADVQDRKRYLVDPSEYGYDETAGSVTFAGAQSSAYLVYVTLDYEYLRVSSEQDRMCSDCHTEAAHMGANCLVCHTAHATSNNSLVRESVRTPAGTESAVVFTNTTGAGSFADGDATYDGICEVCHTGTLYHTNDGSGFANHTGSGVNQSGVDCTACHTHASGFAK